MILNRRTIARGGLGLALAAALPRASLAAATTHAVTVDPAGSKFAPGDLTIRVGDTVEWENTAFVGHSVTFDPARSKVAGNVVLPAGAEPFDSGLMKAGARFSHTFTTRGAYRYICRFHEAMGMVGSVTVK